MLPPEFIAHLQCQLRPEIDATIFFVAPRNNKACNQQAFDIYALERLFGDRQEGS